MERPHGRQAALLLRPIAFAVLAALAPGAHAQQAERSESLLVTGERLGSFRSDRVQVGTFRDMDPLEVPLTSNVVTRGVLDAQGATTLFGALRNTAGVTRSQLSGSTYDNLSIRGILVENRGNYRLNGSLPIINLVDIPRVTRWREGGPGLLGFEYLYPLHTGALGGSAHRALAAGAGLALFLLGASGAWLWWKRGRRVS